MSGINNPTQNVSMTLLYLYFCDDVISRQKSSMPDASSCNNESTRSISYRSPPRLDTPPPQPTSVGDTENIPQPTRWLTEDTYFEQPQLQNQETLENALHPVILGRLQQAVMDNFVFKFSSVVCSLEYNQLVDCFQQDDQARERSQLRSNEPAKNGAKTDTAGQRRCIAQSKQYGNCAYSRFNQVVGLLCVHKLKCKSAYDMYEGCLKLLSTPGSAESATAIGSGSGSVSVSEKEGKESSESRFGNFFTTAYRFNQVQGTKRTIARVEPCETLLWRPLYKCVTKHLRTDPPPFNE